MAESCPGVLYFIYRVPGSAGNERENLTEILSELGKKFKVDCIILRSLFLKEHECRPIIETGAGIILFNKPLRRKDMRESPGKVTGGFKYKYIFFDSVFTAKYFAYFLKRELPETGFVIDFRESRYLSELKNAGIEYGSFFEIPEKLILLREKELPVLSYHGAVIVKDSIQKEDLKREITGPLIINAARDGEICTELEGVSPCKNFLFEREVQRITYGYSEKDEKKSLKEINSALSGSPGNGLILIIPSGSEVPQYFEEALMMSLKSGRKNDVALPLSRCRLSKFSREKIPPPSDRKKYSEFLERHRLGNFAEWRIVTALNEPCFMMKGSLAEEIGVLDERFNSVYYSFVDYGFRVLQKGGRIILNQEAFINLVPEVEKFHSRYHLYSDQRRLADKWGIRSAGFLENLREHEGSESRH